MPDTKTQILNAAQELFSQNGFHGVGIREITQRARVNLGAINYHFGSKADLYVAMIRRHADPVNRERIERINALVAQKPLPPVRELFRAFVMPLARAMLRDGRPDMDLVRLVARVFSEEVDVMGEVRERLFSDVRETFSRALRVYFPDAPHSVLQRRFYLAFSTLAGAIIQLGKFEMISRRQLDAKAFDRIFEDVVEFVTAGFSAVGNDERRRK